MELSLLERCERLLCSWVVVVVEGASASLIRPRGLVLVGGAGVAGAGAGAAADGGGGGTSSLAADFKRRASLKLVDGLGLRGVQGERWGEELLPLRKGVVGRMKALVVAAVLRVGRGRKGG